MTVETLEEAIFRLDAAVARAEAALAARPPAPAVAPAPEDSDLAERHDRLRAGTEAAIARLDRLIGPELP